MPIYILLPTTAHCYPGYIRGIFQGYAPTPNITYPQMAKDKLTDTAIKQAKPRDKAYKIFDGGGLFLLVNKNGSKYWRLKYRINDKEKLLALGVYPLISLKEAREKRFEAKKKIAQGIDPNDHKKAEKRAQREIADNSFEAVGYEWLEKKRLSWSKVHASKVEWMLTSNLFPWLGKRPIAEIDPPELLATLRRIESRGALETAKRVKQVAGQVFRYAVATGRANRDPSQDLKEALATPVKSHHAAVTEPKEVGPLLLVLDGYQGSPIVRAALKLAPLTFVRPGELRHAEWTEFDIDAAEWKIPGHKMKAKVDHIVPLSTQAIDALREIYPLTGAGPYVFPSARSTRRPMSNNAVLGAFRRLDIPKEQMTGHGFRAMARTILDEVLGYRVDWIEHQLAHAVKDVHGRAYNRTAHLDKRREMMQGWADYLDQLRLQANSTNVILGKFGVNS